MGLMYVFPVSTEETDFIDLKEESITLKSYGLPYIFWIYAVCALAVVFFMFLAVKEPVLKLASLGDETDVMLGYSLLTFIGLIPVFVFGFFFYEKRIKKTKDQLSMQYRIFGIKVFSETFQCDPQDPFHIDAFLDSPNIAKMKGNEESVGFQNKGYFTLKLKTAQGKMIQIDRHSRKADLVKLQNLLTLVR